MGMVLAVVFDAVVGLQGHAEACRCFDLQVSLLRAWFFFFFFFRYR
jgi:hypothetical protein